MENTKTSEKNTSLTTDNINWEILNNSEILPVRSYNLVDMTENILLSYDNNCLITPLCIKQFENFVFMVYEEFDPVLNNVTDISISVIKGKDDEFKLGLNKDLNKSYTKKENSSKSKLEVFFNRYDISYICFIILENLYIIINIFPQNNTYKLIYMNEFREGRVIPVQYIYSFNSAKEVFDCFFLKGKIKVFKYKIYERNLYCKDLEIELDLNKMGVENIYICDLTLYHLVFSKIKRRNIYILHFKSNYLQKVSSCYKEKLKGIYFIENQQTNSFLNPYLSTRNDRINFISLHSDKSIKLWEMSGNTDAVIPLNLLQTLKITTRESCEDFNFEFIIEGFYAILHLRNERKIILFSLSNNCSYFSVQRIHEFSSNGVGLLRNLRFKLLIEEEEEVKMKLVSFSNNTLIEYTVNKSVEKNVIIPTLSYSTTKSSIINYNSEFATISNLIKKVVILPSFIEYKLEEKIEKSMIENNKMMDLIQFSLECRIEKTDNDKRLKGILEKLTKESLREKCKATSIPSAYIDETE
jgi:hypothetical protein